MIVRFIIIKVFRLQRKTFLLFYCFFLFIIFIIIIIFLGLIRDFLSRFLIDFREIFREYVSWWKIFAPKILRKGSLPVSSYVPFSDFFETHFVQK